MEKIFLDYASGCPVDKRIIPSTVKYYAEDYGNPSSLHSFGLEAKNAVEEARQSVANLINAQKKEEIIFTSGATESNNLALLGYSLRNRGSRNKIIVSKIEHMSIINVVKYLSKLDMEVVYAPVDKDGRLIIEKLDELIDNNTLLVSVAYANGEIGTIQDIVGIARIAHSKGAILHSDGVPAVGRMDVDVIRDDVDMLTISSNDIYGPRGMGGLYVKSGTKLQPIILGGGQERGFRSGTENLPSIVGFEKAVTLP